MESQEQGGNTYSSHVARGGLSIRDRYVVRHIPSALGKEFIKKHHYSHGSHNGPTCFGLFELDELLPAWMTLIGVCAFATPCSENVRRSIFGRGNENRVTELHRLVVLDGTPVNTESFFIARSIGMLRQLKPMLWGIISFADATEGHVGVIYQASNFVYTGTSGRAKFWLDETGRLRHPRQNGVNISAAEAASRGWIPAMREGKHRYVKLLSKAARQNFLLDALPYPKHATVTIQSSHSE